jgi:hypothetical protein
VWCFLRSDVARFCGEIADLAPAVRLARLAELRAMLDEVVLQAMADAQAEGWGLRRIGKHAGVSHEQVRRMLVRPEAQPTTPG